MHECPYCGYGFHEPDDLATHLNDGCPEAP